MIEICQDFLELLVQSLFAQIGSLLTVGVLDRIHRTARSLLPRLTALRRHRYRSRRRRSAASDITIGLNDSLIRIVVLRLSLHLERLTLNSLLVRSRSLQVAVLIRLGLHRSTTVTESLLLLGLQHPLSLGELSCRDGRSLRLLTRTSQTKDRISLLRRGPAAPRIHLGCQLLGQSVHRVRILTRLSREPCHDLGGELLRVLLRTSVGSRSCDDRATVRLHIDRGSLSTWPCTLWYLRRSLSTYPGIDSLR